MLLIFLGLKQSKTFRCNPTSHLATPHAAFSAGAVCKVQLILRRCGGGVELEAWPALHISLTFSCGHTAAHHAPFSAMQVQAAIDFAELRMRS